MVESCRTEDGLTCVAEQDCHRRCIEDSSRRAVRVGTTECRRWRIQPTHWMSSFPLLALAMAAPLTGADDDVDMPRVAAATKAVMVVRNMAHLLKGVLHILFDQPDVGLNSDERRVEKTFGGLPGLFRSGSEEPRRLGGVSCS